MSKKLLSILLALVLVLAVLPAALAADSDVTVSVSIADYASANGWADATQYKSLKMDDVVTVSVTGTTNTGKYYVNGNNWRIYQSEAAEVTVAAAEGNIVSVKITYTPNKNGCLTNGSTKISSDTVVEVNAPSITFGLGNTGTATNGQVRITNIEVVYAVAEAEPETCTVTYDLNAAGDENVWGELEPAVVESGSTLELPVRADHFDRPYYVFKGWFTAAEGGEEVTNETPINETCTLYAHWEERTTITLILYVSEITGTDPETGESVGDWVTDATVVLTAPDGTEVPSEAGTGNHEGGLIFRDLVAADTYTLTITREGYKTYTITTQGDPYDAGISLAEMGLHSGGVIFSTAGIWEAEPEGDPVAAIGDDLFYSLQEALNVAVAGEGSITVEILEDIDLTGTDWTPVFVSGKGYPVVTVEGNGKSITGLNDMLFSGTWAGKSGLHIKDLTIKNSTIEHDVNDESGNIGVGAFIGGPGASTNNVSLTNCHLVDSTVSGGHWTGGLIGWANGYSGTDGPVFMTLTIDGCSVTGCTITGKGSVGGIIGHGAGDAWTQVIITDTTVADNTITSTGSSTNKAGAILGTIGAAGTEKTVNGVTHTGGISVSATVSGNTVTSGGTAITTIYGRQGSSTGVLNMLSGGSYDNYPVEDGVSYVKLAEGYIITENENGTYTVKKAPSGKVAYRAYVLNSSREAIQIDMEKIYAEESLVIELWCGDTLLTTTEYAGSYPCDRPGYTTACVALSGVFASWDTTIADGVRLGIDNIPDTIKVYADGTLTDTFTHSSGTVLADKVNDYIALDSVFKPVSVTDSENNVTKYTTLQAAVDAAQPGETVTLLDDIELTETLVIAKGANVVIDLNGKTISGVDNVAGTSAVITNKGTLEIKDSAEGGKVTTKALYPDTDWSNEEGTFPSYANNTIRNEGTFILTSGTIENTTPAGGATYCIDNYGGSSCTINGGKVINENTLAIRLFCGSGISLTINGGEIIGTRAIWVQLASSDPAVAPEVNVTVTGGTITRTKDTDVALYSYTYGNSAANVNISISGGIFNGDIGLTGGKNKTAVETLTITGGTFTDVYSYAADEVASETITITAGSFAVAPNGAYLAENYVAVANANGTYTVEVLSLSNAAAAIGDTPYATLAEAVAAAQNGDVVTLVQTPEFTGLMEVDGTWYYFANGTLDWNYNGLVDYYGTLFAVSNSKVDWGCNGLVEFNGGLYYVVNGAVDTSFTGLYESYYVVNGVVDTAFVGLVEQDGSLYYVSGGVVDVTYTSLAQYNGVWYYVNAGAVDLTYTGLADYYGTQFYVVAGMVDWSSTGLVAFNGGLYYISGGVVDLTYTSLAQFDGVWYYVNAGVVDLTYTGLAEYYSTMFYVANGTVDWATVGLVECNGGLYYVAGGTVDLTYTSLAQFEGVWYYVINGVVDTGFTGMVDYYGTWFYIANGMVDWGYTGLAEHGGNLFYINGGVLDWSYTGPATGPDGVVYPVIGGVAQPV